jgi:hypothetical protein
MQIKNQLKYQGLRGLIVGSTGGGIMRHNIKLIGTLLILILSPMSSWSKDLTNRLGIGYSDQFSTELPSLTAKYYPSSEMGLSAALGVNTGPQNSKFGLLFKVQRIIFPEDNLHFYMGAGAGLLSTKVDTRNESGFELMGFAGAEFFLTGLDSLGISFETGVGITSVSSGVTFRTIGDHPLRAGIIFYF